ncbi:MAG: hypothetical protein ABI970_13460 [Chloroflexota bacterium]
MKIGVIIFLVFITCGSFIYNVLPSCNENEKGCYDNDQAILSHSAEAPYQYRVLAPYVMSLVATPANQSAWFSAALLLHLVSFAVIYTGLYAWLRRWGSESSAMSGLFLMALLLAFSFHQYPLSPNSIIELALICATLVMWKRFWLVVVMVILASLNRETGVLLVAIYALLNIADYRSRGFYIRVLVLGWIWAGITAALHLTLGAVPHVLGLMGTLQSNIENLSQALIINLILLSLWIMAIIGYRRSPIILKRLGWLALAYLFTALVGGLWAEMARLSLPAIPLILPFLVAEKPIQDKLVIS